MSMKSTYANSSGPTVCSDCPTLQFLLNSGSLYHVAGNGNEFKDRGIETRSKFGQISVPVVWLQPDSDYDNLLQPKHAGEHSDHSVGPGQLLINGDECPTSSLGPWSMTD